MIVRYIRTCVYLALLILPLMLAGCFLLPDQKFKEFQHVEAGMTQKQVIDQMGTPDHTDPATALREGEAPTEFYIWETKQNRMVVQFKDGKVIHTGYYAK